jgi:hypothetical protein
MGMKLRHDLEGGNGKAKRGWKGLGLVERTDCGNPKNESIKSGALTDGPDFVLSGTSEAS